MAHTQLTARRPTSIALTQLIPCPTGLASSQERSCASSSAAARSSRKSTAARASVSSWWPRLSSQGTLASLWSSSRVTSTSM